MSVIPEAYISLLVYKNYGNLTSSDLFKPTSVYIDALKLLNLSNMTSVVDLDIKYHLGSQSNCSTRLPSTAEFPSYERNTFSFKLVASEGRIKR